jgi:hypothetical protein
MGNLSSGSEVASSAATQAAWTRVHGFEESGLFQRWRHGRALELPEHELAEIFRCIPANPRATWIGRFNEAVIATDIAGRTPRP